VLAAGLVEPVALPKGRAEQQAGLLAPVVA
jgi:hypothetical protein